MKGAFTALFAVIALIGCMPVPDFADAHKEKIYLKEVDLKQGRFIWYYRSLISNNSPDFVVYVNGDTLDTLCTSSNIAQFFVMNDTIGLGFYGAPRHWSEQLDLPHNFRNRFVVIVDTNCAFPDTRFLRHDYMKEEAK